MPSPWRNRSSAPTPAPRSLSGRRGAPCSSPHRSPASSALSTRRAGQAGCLRLRPRREGAGAADGAGDPRAAEAADAVARRRRAGGRDLPRARAAAAEGDRVVIARLRGKPVARRPDGLVARRQRRRVPRRRDAGACCDARDGADEVVIETYLRRARGRAAALRVRRRGRARAVRAAALGQRRGAEDRARDRLRLAASELRRAIALEDTARFEAIPGIGKKTAQRVVLELKEKIGDGAPISERGAGRPHSSRATRSSSSATRSSTPSRRSPRSIPSCRPRSACARR